MNISSTANLEALLFTAGEPLSFAKLGKTLGLRVEEVEERAKALQRKYQVDPDAGLQLILKDGEAILVSRAEAAPAVEALTKSALQEQMSKAALEVLSIVAYRAPITRAEIESIRGVNCTFTLRNLLLRDLIERTGNPEDARGYVYRPSFKLLEHLGLGSVEELPDYMALSQDERLESLLAEDSTENTEAKTNT